MNVFIYDTVTDKNRKTVRKFEEQINKLSLQGKIIYLKDIKNPKEIIEKEVNNGAKTIIILGNDETVNTLVNILANISQNIPIFVVPIGNKNNIANALGVKNEKEAPFILSARRLERLNVGKINNEYFISNCHLRGSDINISINNEFSVKTQKNSEHYIFNLLDINCSTQNNLVSPQDKILNLVINTNSKDKTIVPIEGFLEIDQQEVDLIVDNSKIIKSPVKISSSEKFLHFIVGKDRSF
ncbi:MAG: diacylglycerol kinase family protein [Patescibacteria group bacterium]